MSTQKIVDILLEKHKNNGWSLIRTRKLKPFSYIGYMLTIYDKDDVTIKEEIRAKTLKGLKGKIYQYLHRCNG